MVSSITVLFLSHGTEMTNLSLITLHYILARFPVACRVFALVFKGF